MYKLFIKRILDILIAGIGIIITSPILIVTALLVRIKLGKPVLFKQARPGKNGKIFFMYKFRTMTDARDEKGELLPDEDRLTSFGKFLRASSLDELPELINILKGNMSLVGPRPLLVQYLPLYNEEQKRRHEVTPGITGYAQVHGRNSISWEEKFKMDVYYVDHVSFLLDCKILCKTFQTVIKREGIHSATSATMEPFQGSEYRGNVNE